MKKGNLVMLNNLDCPASKPGLVLGIDKDYYGARQAFKVYAPVERGKAIRGNMVDGIGPTKDFAMNTGSLVKLTRRNGKGDIFGVIIKQSYQTYDAKYDSFDILAEGRVINSIKRSSLFEIKLGNKSI